MLLKSLIPGFHARQDTVTPVRIALVAVAVNVSLKVVLMGPLAQVGLALATSASAWINAGLLAWALKGRGFLRVDERLRRRAPRIVLASVVMGGVLALGQSLAAPVLADPHLVVRAGVLGILCSAGMAVFAVLVLLTGAVSRNDLRRLARRG